MPGPHPSRGEVWDVRFPVSGDTPAVVLSVSPLNPVLRHVVVLPITGTPGPELTHVPLTSRVGLAGNTEAYADISSLQPAARGRLVRRRGRLRQSELARVEAQLRTYLGFLPKP